MAEPKGPYLPRKDTGLARHRGLLEAAAYQAGVLVAIERNRGGWTQQELADEIGTEQTTVSQIENGRSAKITDDQVDAMFGLIGLPTNTLHANFIKWWRENGTL